MPLKRESILKSVYPIPPQESSTEKRMVSPEEPGGGGSHHPAIHLRHGGSSGRHRSRTGKVVLVCRIAHPNPIQFALPGDSLSCAAGVLSLCSGAPHLRWNTLILNDLIYNESGFHFPFHRQHYEHQQLFSTL